MIATRLPCTTACGHFELQQAVVFSCESMGGIAKHSSFFFTQAHFQVIRWSPQLPCQFPKYSTVWMQLYSKVPNTVDFT